VTVEGDDFCSWPGAEIWQRRKWAALRRTAAVTLTSSIRQPVTHMYGPSQAIRASLLASAIASTADSSMRRCRALFLLTRC